MFSVVSYDKASQSPSIVIGGSTVGFVRDRHLHYGFVYDASELTVTHYRGSLSASPKFQHLGKSMTNCSHIKGTGQFLPVSPSIKELVEDQSSYTIFAAFGTDADHTIPNSMAANPDREVTYHLHSSSFPYIVGYSSFDGKDTYVSRMRCELLDSRLYDDKCEVFYEYGSPDKLKVFYSTIMFLPKRPKIREIYRDIPGYLVKKLKFEHIEDHTDLMYTVQTQAALTLSRKPQNAAMAIMRLKELVSGEFIESLAKTYAKTSLNSAKSVADTYLSTRYGLKLSIASMRTYFDEVGALLTTSGYNRLGRAKGSQSFPTYDGRPVEFTYSYLMRCAQAKSPFVDLAYKLRSHGFVFTLKDAWDFIPYSFVLDWVLAISEYLDIMDASLFLDKHPILGSVETFKVTRDMDPIEFGLGLEYCGVVRLTHFTRQCGYNLPVTLLPPPLQAPTSQNYLDGAMLVIQRTM